ncbi:MAG: YciI family protein [Candidatus Hodarchaeales archaeon]|jgi:uncharacterized protein YciI
MSSKRDLTHFFATITPYRNDFVTNPIEEENKIMSDHFLYLKDLMDKGKLFLAGPTLNLDDPFGVLILQVDTIEEAKELLKNDPSCKSGLQTVSDLRPIRLSLVKMD